ncbi:MAG: AAA family ATPase [Alteromonadaceae bacterium]|nr:MAG: AAA family ATPase [Alteromonadaceae bacterium]
MTDTDQTPSAPASTPSTPGADDTSKRFAQANELIQALTKNINERLIGQTEVVEQIIIALLANGHVLVEGVPGLGKTLLVRTLADCISGAFSRIQFTPDLMPADITGHVLYDMKESKFRLRRGPIFTNLLLADEINRAPAKTQAALLEVMQERQVTLEGNSQKVPQPFMVMATQNPVEQEGTYPLPEAELDRFIMKIYIDYPNLEDEILMTKAVTSGQLDSIGSVPDSEAVLDTEQMLSLQALVSDIAVDEQVLQYAVRLTRATRESSAIFRGASSRACIALIRCARAKALLRGNDYVLPDDIKAMAAPVMRHRIALAAEVEIDGLSPDQVLAQVFAGVEAPRL